MVIWFPVRYWPPSACSKAWKSIKKPRFFLPIASWIDFFAAAHGPLLRPDPMRSCTSQKSMNNSKPRSYPVSRVRNGFDGLNPAVAYPSRRIASAKVVAVVGRPRLSPATIG